MSEEEKIKPGVSRREFLKDAGLVVGGATVGSMAFMSSCKAPTTATTTVTSPPVTTTVTNNITSYIDSIDGTSWPSLDALKAHFNAVHPNADASIVNFIVNGVSYAFQVKPTETLNWTLREQLHLFALKSACMLGECGACTVIVDGAAVFSCLMLTAEMEGRTVVTEEGLSNNGAMNPVQQKFFDQEVAGCGFCTPGFVMAAQALISVNPKPTLADVQLAFSGHMCMCCDNHRHVLATVGGV
jgi:aerobic carbon-monoxide dehydrogenase small subunit